MIEAIVRRPVSVVVATVAVCALGLFSLLKLPVSLLPTIEKPSLVITARSAASSRESMLHDVTEPIERRLPSISGIASIESETTSGESRITVRSAWQTDPDRLRIDVARRIEGAAVIGLDDMSIETIGTDVLPVIEVGVAGGSGGGRTRFAERVLLPDLARIEGAGKIDLIGATPLRATVEPSAAALAARGLTAADVETRLRSVGETLAAGRVRDGAAVRPVVVAQPVRTPADLAAILVRQVPLAETAKVEVREVGDETSFRVWRREAARVDSAGQPPAATQAVLLRVHRAPGANAVALARSVRARLDDLRARTRDVQLLVVADRSLEVTRALGELALAAILGVLLGTLILRYVLGAWTPTLALAVVVPVALLASFMVFYAAGIPLDVISLAGLALATGLLVDNSIVVLESIENARSAGTADPEIRGTRQIIVAVVASSITLVIVFAPLLYLRGLARAIFGEQAVAVVASVSASLLLSLTLTPVLARRGGASHSRNPGQRRYLDLLDRFSAMPARAALVAIAMTLLAIATGWLLPRELFAHGAERSIALEMDVTRQVSPEAMRRQADAIWAAVAGSIDRAEVLSMAMTQPAGDEPLTVVIELRSSRAATRVLESLRSRVTQFPGVRARLRIRPSAFVEAIGGDASRLELVASAATQAEADALARRVSAEAVKRGLVAIDDAQYRASTAMVLRWDDARLVANGVDRSTAERDVRAALGNLDVGQVDIAGADPSIRLLPTRPGDVAVVPIRVGETVVPLGALAATSVGERAPVIVHDEGRPARRLTFEGRASEWHSVPLAGSERLRVAGHALELGDAYAQMRIAAILGLILLYLTVAAFYESLVLPLLVLAAFPFAAGGGLVALLITGQTLNLMSIIGLIFLGGIVVNHTVVLLDRAEQLRRADSQSAGPAGAPALRAAADRYRPVMMTTATAILGMLPLALLGGDGVELRRPIAIVVIGGLLTATAGTLLLIPLLHRAVDPWRRGARSRRAARVSTETAHA